VARFADGGHQREGLECNRNEENPDCDGEAFGLVGMTQLLDALVQGEETAHAEQHERDDEGPEVTLAAVAERTSLARPSFRPVAAEQQQCLVAGVGE